MVQVTRHASAGARGSETDSVTFETFIQNEQREMNNSDPNKQNLGAVMKLWAFLQVGVIIPSPGRDVVCGGEGESYFGGAAKLLLQSCSPMAQPACPSPHPKPPDKGRTARHAMADFRFTNDGTQEELFAQVRAALASLK